MKKIVSLAFTVAILSCAFAQTSPGKLDLANRAGDHLMIQLSSDHWTGLPDTISSHQKGFSRGFNMYFMVDKPFKTDPHWSIAFGIGLSNSSIFFKSMTLDLTATNTNVLPFQVTDSADHYKKYKLATTFLDVPIELRYTFHPEKEKKSWKLAAGVKVGLMLDAHTKAKDFLDRNGNLLDDYTQKQSRTAFFNTTRLCATARVGHGNLSLFGSYQINPVLKSGSGPDIQFFQIGICLSGL